MAMPVRLLGVWVSENTNVNAWLEPDPEFGDTESAEGSGARRVAAVKVPLFTHPVLIVPSDANINIFLSPLNGPLNVILAWMMMRTA